MFGVSSTWHRYAILSIKVTDNIYGSLCGIERALPGEVSLSISAATIFPDIGFTIWIPFTITEFFKNTSFRKLYYLT